MRPMNWRKTALPKNSKMGKTPEDLLKTGGLVGAYMERADLRGYNLSGANLTAINLRGADLTEANLSGATMIRADLSRACLYRANFEGVNMDASDLSMSYAKSTSFKDASMRFCAFKGVSYKNCFFWGTDLHFADFRGAFLLGSAFNDVKGAEYIRNLHHALFSWYRHPEGGGPIYEPREGWKKLTQSAIPGYSFQENAGPGRT